MKITEYSQISVLESENVFIVDGPTGTKKISAADLPFALLNLTSVNARRLIFRGKNLGNQVTNEQKSAIQNGTFEGLWIGDYWEIGGVKYRIADFDYWYGSGSPAFSNHHLVIVPDTALYAATMNGSSVTTGGYVGSLMYTTNLSNAKITINSAFPSLVLTHKEYLINAVSSGYPSAGAWTDSGIDLMNEPMVYGSYIYTPANNGTTDVKRYTNSNTQLALFRIRPSFIICANGMWLRDVASTTHFCRADSTGGATSTGAANEFGVRPAFAIG